MSDRARAGVLGRSRMIVDVLRATHRRFVRDRMVDGAAGLAFYMLFSLIPMLLIFGAIINLLGADAAHNLVDLAGDEGASASLEGALDDALDTAVKSPPEGAGAIGLVGLGTLFYGASRGITAAGRALDVIAGRNVLARPLLRRAKDVGWTIVLLLLVGVLLGLVFVTGGLFRRLVELVGLGHVGTAVWDVLHWPVAFLVGMVVVALVVFTAPSERPRAFRPWTLGSLFSVLVFLTASAVYALYLSNIANHNATYGAFAAVVILMLWAWMASLAFLFGAELDAELDAGRPGL